MGLSWFRPWGRTFSKGVCESTVLSCTGGACSRGYKRGERGREAPRSLLEEELIEMSANIGARKSVCVLPNGPTTPLKESPPPPFIDTRRDGVHAQGIVEVVVFSPNRGGAVVGHCGKYTVEYGGWRDRRPGCRPWPCGDRAGVLVVPASGVVAAVEGTILQAWRGDVPRVLQARVLSWSRPEPLPRVVPMLFKGSAERKV